MKLKIYHWYNALLSALLTMLGFGSCTLDTPEEYGAPPVMEGPVEYGTPYVEYIIDGYVTDEQNQPVEGVKAVVREMPEEYPEYTRGIDSTRTNAAGKFRIESRNYVHQDLKLVLEDTDGQANGGEFQGDTIRLNDLEKTLVEKGQGWSNGTYEVKANVKLKKKP